jgi:hypothetical protein
VVRPLLSEELEGRSWTGRVRRDAPLEGDARKSARKYVERIARTCKRDEKDFAIG